MEKLKREKPEARDRILNFRVSEVEMATLDVVADEEGVTMSDLLRAALDDYMARRRRKAR